jgi:general secretion pathway protein G
MTTVQKNTARRLRKGFTLMEILVAVAIVGMLVGLAVTNVGKILGEGQEFSAKTMVNDSMKTALLNYRLAVGDYPSTEEGLKALVAAPEGKTGWRGPYLDAKGGRVPVDPWGHEFQYRYPGTKNTESSSTPYDLFSIGKDNKPDTEDDIGNW